jgi:ribosomal protein S27E
MRVPILRGMARSIPCPVCGRIVTVVDVTCWACGSVLGEQHPVQVWGQEGTGEAG